MGTGNTSLSEAVLAAVAEREGISQSELPTPLYDAVNPEALDDLFRDSPGHVTFEYAGYLVTVDSSGSVDLEAVPGAER